MNRGAIHINIKTMKIVVIISGGCVTKVVTSENCEVEVLDMDTEDVESKDLVIVPDGFEEWAYKYVGDVQETDEEFCNKV